MGSAADTLTGNVAFTGRLAAMRRAQAFALVRQLGGRPRRGVTKDTDVLVVGRLGWPLMDDGRPSNSLRKAKTIGVPVLSEPRFLEATGLSGLEDETKAYTNAQIVTLSGLPGGVVEQLVVFGLLDPRDGRFGFRDLAAARQIAGLLAGGVKLSAICHSLHELRAWLPDAGLPTIRLVSAGTDELVVSYLEGQTTTRGQYVLPLERAVDDVEAVFEQAELAEQNEHWTAAERLYRRAMRLDPRDASAPFNLANMLRDLGRHVEAETLFRAATTIDPMLAEAWFNLADVLEEGNRREEAVTMLRRATDINPDYADAFFNLGLLEQKLGQFDQAARHWRKYLALDTGSHWSARVRRALKYCELRVAGPSSI